MKSLAQKIQDVRAWLGRHAHMIPGSSSYIMQLDGITHDVGELEHKLERTNGLFAAADAALNGLKVKHEQALLQLEELRRGR